MSKVFDFGDGKRRLGGGGYCFSGGFSGETVEKNEHKISWGGVLAGGFGDAVV